MSFKIKGYDFLDFTFDKNQNLYAKKISEKTNWTKCENQELFLDEYNSNIITEEKWLEDTAARFNLAFGDWFILKEFPKERFKFTRQGLVDDSLKERPNVLSSILDGAYKPIKHWIPKNNQWFFYIEPDGCIREDLFFKNSAKCLALLPIGNFSQLNLKRKSMWMRQWRIMTN